jgi:hypothetical protein
VATGGIVKAEGLEGAPPGESVGKAGAPISLSEAKKRPCAKERNQSEGLREHTVGTGVAEQGRGLFEQTAFERVPPGRMKLRRSSGYGQNTVVGQYSGMSPRLRTSKAGAARRPLVSA